MNKKTKTITVLAGLGIMYGGFLASILTKDNSVSYIENKILTKFPRLSVQTIISGRFMEQFDSYATDQFPERVEFINLKNNFDFIIGKREFRGIYLTSTGRLLEHFKLNKKTLYDNIEGINKLSEKLNLKSSFLLIPTSIALYKDELPYYAITDDQEKVFDMIKENVRIKFFSALDILKEHKHEEIFFKTDHHWTQLGAKITFEDIFNKEVAKDLTMVSDEFYGSYYSKALVSGIKPDTLSAYKGIENHKIHIDYERELNSLYDKTKLNTKNKYQYFLSGDPGRALIEGKGEGTILILKDSFAHNFVPFLCSEFKEIHIIDPRYYNTDIEEYITKFNISEIFFIHNINTLNTQNVYDRFTVN